MPSRVTYRQIPPEEWPRLKGIYEANEIPLPPAEKNSAVVAEFEGKIVGMQGIHQIWHAGPIWVAPEWRGVGVSDRMDKEIQRIVRECGASGYFMFPANPFSEAAVRRFGLKEMSWKVFVRES